MRNVRIGDYLVEKGLITQEQLETFSLLRERLRVQKNSVKLLSNSDTFQK